LDSLPYYYVADIIGGGSHRLFCCITKAKEVLGIATDLRVTAKQNQNIALSGFRAHPDKGGRQFQLSPSHQFRLV